VVALHRAGMAPAQISKVISIVADALVARMIELAIGSEGEPPADFAWLALGSHGRREPVPSSDVDSGMAWSDLPDGDTGPRRVREAGAAARYMHSIAEDVQDCIRVVGWRLDPHGVNAAGRFSASSIGDWRRSIREWLSHPEPEKVLVAISIMVDGRVAYGNRDLDPTRAFYEDEHRVTLTRWMLRQALATKPPTGFRRDIVVEDTGEHRGTLDIKHGGLLPVVNLARFASFKADVRVNSTIERLRAAADAGTLEPTQATALDEAFDLFTGIRLEHQVQQLERRLDPDDHLDPLRLNPLTRRYLRDAFREVAAVQKSVGRTHGSRR
jgi:CBS domain-containing protein